MYSAEPSPKPSASAEAVIALAQASRLGYEFTFAGVPIFRETETDHILVWGAPGSGKGVAIKDLLDQIRAHAPSARRAHNFR